MKTLNEILTASGLPIETLNDGLLSLPARVAREALQSVAALAAGDDATWRAVKRLRSVTPPLWSVRVGIHHRLLFRIEQEGALELLELFHRKDLEGVLKQRRYL